MIDRVLTTENHRIKDLIPSSKSMWVDCKGKLVIKDAVDKYQLPFLWLDPPHEEADNCDRKGFWKPIRDKIYSYDRKTGLYKNNIKCEDDAFQAFIEYVEEHSEIREESVFKCVGGVPAQIDPDTGLPVEGTEVEGTCTYESDGGFAWDWNFEMGDSESARAYFTKALVTLAFTHQALFYVGTRDMNYVSDMEGTRLSSPVMLSILPPAMRCPSPNDNSREKQLENKPGEDFHIHPANWIYWD